MLVFKLIGQKHSLGKWHQVFTNPFKIRGGTLPSLFYEASKALKLKSHKALQTKQNKTEQKPRRNIKEIKRKGKLIVFMDTESNCTYIRRMIDHDQIIYPKNIRTTLIFKTQWMELNTLKKKNAKRIPLFKCLWQNSAWIHDKKNYQKTRNRRNILSG